MHFSEFPSKTFSGILPGILLWLPPKISQGLFQNYKRSSSKKSFRNTSRSLLEKKHIRIPEEFFQRTLLDARIPARILKGLMKKTLEILAENTDKFVPIGNNKDSSRDSSCDIPQKLLQSFALGISASITSRNSSGDFVEKFFHGLH